MKPDWKFPAEIVGWLSEAEGRRLAELAEDKNVLEIGSYCGVSTVCIAQTAKSVTAVDPGDGRATPLPVDTIEELAANLVRYGVRDRVTIKAGTTAEIAPQLAPGYDLIFIDGDHSRKAVEIDAREAFRLLAPDGLIAFHDYQSIDTPAVTHVVNELVNNGAEIVSCVDSLVIVRPGTCKGPQKPLVLIAMSRRGEQVGFGAARGYFFWPSNGAVNYALVDTTSTVLDHGFNRVWATTLNKRDQGVTHFAMIHDDIAPCQGWVDILVNELIETGADIMSAVVPIKTEHGLTSTAVETDDLWFPRRLTMKEVHDKLPATFTDKEVGGELLLNSGLWVCDIRRPWVDTPEPMTFQTVNRIIKDEHGKWQAQARSEDWEFSRAARKRGAKLAATRKVSLYHAGEAKFQSDSPWGVWETDEVHEERLNGRGDKAAAFGPALVLS